MGWEVGVHEGFEVGSVPLGEGGVDVPVCGGLGGGEGAGGVEAVVEAGFEAGELVDVVGEVVAGSVRISVSLPKAKSLVWAGLQLEEGVRDL